MLEACSWFRVAALLVEYPSVVSKASKASLLPEEDLEGPELSASIPLDSIYFLASVLNQAKSVIHKTCIE